MSTSFTLYCETCEEAGPPIRRHHDKGVLLQQRSVRFFPSYEPEQGALDWGSFLIEHEYHDLRLIHEYDRVIARREQERQKAEAEAAKPRYRLLDNGGLERIV